MSEDGPHRRVWGPGSRPPPPEMLKPDPEHAVDDARRTVILDWTVNEYVATGWRVESRSPTQAVLVRGDRVNHVLHAVLTIFTCLLWGIVWIVIAATSKIERVSLTVDQLGHVDVVQSPG